MKNIPNNKVIETPTAIRFAAFRFFTFFLYILYAIILLAVPAYILYKWNFAYAEQINNYLKTVIWPIIALLFLFNFEPEIRTKIGQMTRAETPAGIIEFGKQQQEKANREEMNEEKSKEINELIEQNKWQKEKIDRAQNETLHNFLNYHFEKTYRLIFGSQLAIVKIISTNGHITEALAYELWRRSPSYPGYEFKAYMSFLINAGLIKYIASDNRYVFSPIGNLFTAYLNKENLSWIKPS